MVACTFCAGCIDDPIAPLPVIRQENLDTYLSYLDNPPSNYTIEKIEISDIIWDKNEVSLKVIRKTPNSISYTTYYVDVRKESMANVDKGLSLNFDTFVLKLDDAESLNYAIIFNFDGYKDMAFWYLTPEDYEWFIKEAEERAI